MKQFNSLLDDSLIGRCSFCGIDGSQPFLVTRSEMTRSWTFHRSTACCIRIHKTNLSSRLCSILQRIQLNNFKEATISAIDGTSRLRLSPYLGDQSLTIVVPSLWNNLPLNLRDSQLSHLEFRQLLKTNLFCRGQQRLVTIAVTAPYKLTFTLYYIYHQLSLQTTTTLIYDLQFQFFRNTTLRSK